jgi:hypothetical protein
MINKTVKIKPIKSEIMVIKAMFEIKSIPSGIERDTESQYS